MITIMAPGALAKKLLSGVVGVLNGGVNVRGGVIVEGLEESSVFIALPSLVSHEPCVITGLSLSWEKSDTGCDSECMPSISVTVISLVIQLELKWV